MIGSRGGSKIEVEVSVLELVAKIRANRVVHVAVFKEAHKKWKEIMRNQWMWMMRGVLFSSKPLLKLLRFAWSVRPETILAGDYFVPAR